MMMGIYFAIFSVICLFLYSTGTFSVKAIDHPDHPGASYST